MCRLSIAILVSLALAGCGSVAAATADSKNPAHCVAAINHTNYWLRKSDNSELVLNGLARAVFELDKIRASGASLEKAKAQAEALTQSLQDPEKMNALALECLTAQDRDPQFQKELPRLLAIVRANPQLAE